MIELDLQNIQPGFNEQSTGSQLVFRVALNALSYPGRIWTVDAESGLPSKGHAAAAKLMLSLLDDDCSVWLSSSLENSDVPSWLRFHTGCHFVKDIALADFVWIGQDDTVPALDSMKQGDDEYPDQSATCLIEVNELTANNGGWRLEGPGIESVQEINVSKLINDFEAQWARNHGNFPKGVDAYLVHSNIIAGLPRTTTLRSVSKE